jgi:DNA mismatch repair ATPase MutS
MLNKYAALLKEIEAKSFESELLQSEQDRLKRRGKLASEAIADLGQLTYMLDQRLNAFAGLLLNGMVLWDIKYMVRLEKWRENHKEELPVWLDVIGKWDALLSWARFRYNHPSFVLPEVSEGEFLMEAKGLGHPLLDPATRVDNDMTLAKPGEFLIITGANMAGKSTFLRTVGVNLVLAMNGSVVCAQNFRFRPIELLTSVRATDSLQDHESYFYAELKRLKMLIDKLREGKPVFIIVDEMLRGTNSRDKQEGSRQFIKQLIQLKGVGMIATHDLSLGTLQDEFPGFARNKRFEVDITDEQLSFDYKLRDGISQNLNATFLMKQMGIMP